MSKPVGKGDIPYQSVLIAGGKYHDINFARLELLKLLAEDQRVRVRVFEDYSATDAILAADFMVSYTCDVVPSLDEQERLRSFLARGGRWYALHGTNSILRFLKSGQVDSPNWAPHFMETLGSMFIAHPPIAPYQVTVADREDPLVRGVEPFEANDELYLMRTHGELRVLLETQFEGTAEGFVESDWPRAKHPVFYRKDVGKGAVLYLTLGHCRGHYDMQPLMEWYPRVERGSWELPVYYELLRRGIEWAKQSRETLK
ncbi:MAG: ThuA domain-containing protein [Deltaproteobacteria bacterium]|nr:ThuA domain-containing protein [Deltaproteobacteria bacterium]